jgi:hypothetical protein
MHDWRYAVSVTEYVRDTVAEARIDLWDDVEPPLILCESRATAGVLENHAYEYLTPITATGGQSGGFIVNEIVPLLQDKRRVLYVGDHELRGPAEQIEQNTKRYIEQHAARSFSAEEWVKIALTAEQVRRSSRLQDLVISKLDKRYKPHKAYEAVECEALGQGVLVRMIRRHLDNLLPEPLEFVRQHEQRQRDRVQRLLKRLTP